MSLMQRYQALDTTSRYMVNGIGAYAVISYMYGLAHRMRKPAEKPAAPEPAQPKPAEKLPVAAAAAPVAVQTPAAAFTIEDVMKELQAVKTSVVNIEKKLS
eukprot:snap_masked-scaffold_25-processed-gene-1.20-mRNA-1 protein AED:1.00 eAED:1.00 QI:0/-1/0/0/-1/1/1/0/100